jgi:hypothetical protein
MPSAEMRASCCTRGTRLTGGRRGPALVTNVMCSTPAERLTHSPKCQARPGTRGVGGGAKRPKIPPTLVASAYRATVDTRLLALPRSTGLPAGRGLAVCVLLQSIRREARLSRVCMDNGRRIVPCAACMLAAGVRGSADIRLEKLRRLIVRAPAWHGMAWPSVSYH